MTSPFTGVPGAVVDETGLRHLGNPLGEQRALVAGAAVAPLGDRRVLSVTGEDRLTWLDSLTSQALARLHPGTSTELLVLDPHGRVEQAAAVLDDGVTTWLLVDAPRAEGLLAWLRRMRFRLRVDPQDAGDTHAVVAGTAAAIARDVHPDAPSGVPLVWTDPWPGVADGGWGYAPADPHPGGDRDWAEAIVTRTEEERLAQAAVAGDVALAGLTAADALRVAAWRPRATDVDERTIPHELDWLRTAVHLAKGCYRGQETVAKVHNLGHPPRRLVALQLDGSDSVLPEPGAVVRAAGDEVGVVTSAALHFEEGPIALAVVRRSLAAEAELTVEAGGAEIAATQEVVVPADAGATASVPRMSRLSRRPLAR